MADRALGYSLTLPRGWTDSEVPAGATRPFGGGGRGCAMGAAGILDDVRGDRLVAFARRTAERRAAKGALVKARAVRSANVPGAVVALSAGKQQARSAVFVTAGGGVAVTCRVPSDRAAALDRDLEQLYASLRLRRDPALERAQPPAAAVAGVEGITVRRVGTRVIAEVRLASFRRSEEQVRAVIVSLTPRCAGRSRRARGEAAPMPDLAGLLLRKSVGSLDSGSARCSSCHRTPLTGERLHETDGGRRFCELCLDHVPERDRDSIRIERVHATDRHISAAPRAA